MKLSARSLLTLLLIFAWLSPMAGLAQKTTPYTSPDGLTGTSTTSTQKLDNGNTVETTTHDTSGTRNGEYVHDTYQVRVEKDRGGNIVKQTTRQLVAKYDKKGGTQLSQDTFNQTSTYNGIGEETRITDDTSVNNQTGETTDEHTESKFDASGKKTQSHRKTTTHKGGQKTTKNEDWDPSTDTYKEVSMATPSLEPITATPGDGASSESAYLPDVAGPSSTIVATFTDQSQNGPSGQATVAFEDNTGRRTFFRAVTDAQHHLAFKVAEGVAAVWLFKDFTGDRKPDDGAVRCLISRTATVPDSDAVTSAPTHGLAITRASSAYERGGMSNGIVSVETRGNDPATSHLLMDGSSDNINTLAASDMSVKAQLGDNAPLGRHSFSLQSGAQTSNAIPADVVSLRADPVPPGETGSVRTLTVHCDGLPASDPATMYFQVSGSAQLESGEEQTSVPVQDGIARVQIRGVRSGPALVKYKLRAQIAGFWT